MSSDSVAIANRRLILPYAAPFLAYVFIASSFLNQLPPETNYLLRIVTCTSLLIWAWRWYCPITGPKSTIVSIFYGILAGIAGLLVWVALLTPFSANVANEPWTTKAFLLRLTTAGLLVPILEEILMRGFIFRLALQWNNARNSKCEEPLASVLDEQSVNSVRPGAWSYMAIFISTVAFASGHQTYEWPAAIAFGILMSLLWIWRKDLITCIVAHGVTNIALGCYVFATNRWYLW